MCIDLPVKVVSINGRRVFVDILGKKKEVSGLLVKVKKGDYVYLKGNLIVKKVNKKEAEHIIKMFNKQK